MGCLQTTPSIPTITPSGPTNSVMEVLFPYLRPFTGATYDWYRNGVLLVANSNNVYNASTSETIQF